MAKNLASGGSVPPLGGAMRYRNPFFLGSSVVADVDEDVDDDDEEDEGDAVSLRFVG